MRRSPSSPYGSQISFGPGPMSSAMMALIGANVAFFLVQMVLPGGLEAIFGLHPSQVLERFQVWQLVSYMFLHVGVSHILFNMLALWMFGTELERLWGTPYFLKFYFVTGAGAAALTVLFSLLPFGFAEHVYISNIVGASGAIFGLLLAYAMYFPRRPLLLMMLFPVEARYAVMIFGAIELLTALSGVSGVANATHLGGLLVGYLFLKSGRITLSPWAEVKYRYLKWKITRARSRFDVYQGGRANDQGRRDNDWNRRIH